MHTAPQVSVVIPTLNEQAYLPALLNSLATSDMAVEVIVVDGQSDDATPAIVQSHQTKFQAPSSLTLITAPQRGISLQRNLGGRTATSDYMVFCDADVVLPSPQSLAAIIAECVAKNYVVATAPHQPIEQRADIVCVYATLMQVMKLCTFLKRPYFPGSFIVTKRSVFNDSQGFDESIPLAEDVDYSLRASRYGRYGIVHTPITVSARRIIKYGHRWLLKEWRNIIRLALTGKLKHPERIFYPFGVFDGSEQKK
jgi:glycosyltransferase involved in cell wall biosynthesis